MKNIAMKALFSLLFLSLFHTLSGQTIYVSPKGNDKWNGSEKKPVATFQRAQELARAASREESVEVIFEDGIYYLPQAVQFSAQDSKAPSSPTIYRARNEGKAIISGGSLLHLKWTKSENGIFVAHIAGRTMIDQLYINGARQRMARFPNAAPGEGNNVYDTWKLYHKAQPNPAEDPLQPERVARWKNPAGGYVHAMHNRLWGDMHWEVQGKNADGSLNLVGGWQNNRPSPMHGAYRMIENIREELDAPSEWFYNKEEGKLYFIPPADMDLPKAKVEIVRLKHLIEFNGNRKQPVAGVNLKGFVFRHTARTFMENKEQLLRSDWTVYRGGAVVYNGAEDCLLTDCEFDQVGGNTVFVNNYNRRISIKGCYIHRSGANGVAFVGDPNAVRSPLFRYGAQNYEAVDTVPGPQSDNYPKDCVVEDCLITLTGRDEKQTAPIQISMSHKIHVSHCSIYDVPRAGININEGTFGGHLIEYCDVFNTVLETGDHGSFNSWGRDRYWTPDIQTMSDEVDKRKDMPYWDIIDSTTIRNNRWRCDHGWDIDLDDGSSFYRIYNNLLLNGGLKLREGYDRVATNNIIVNNTLFPHVWVRNSRDVFKHNIIFKVYRQVGMENVIGAEGRWGQEIDFNLFVSDKESMTRYAANSVDLHSITGDPVFVDAASGDFRVSDASPALRMGFRNFDMTRFGVKSPKLKALAKTPIIPQPLIALENESPKSEVFEWMGGTLTEPQGEQLSAYGVTFDSGGVAWGTIRAASEAEKAGFQSGDLIQGLNGRSVKTMKDLKQNLEECKKAGGEWVFTVIRAQRTVTVKMKYPKV